MGIGDMLRGVVGQLSADQPAADPELERLKAAIDDDPVSDIVEEWTKREEWMRPRTRRWKESLGFDRGDHWGTWNEQTRSWVGAGFAAGAALRDKPYINHYASIIRTIVSHMTKNRPVAEVLPETSSSDDVESADACNKLLQHVWQDINVQGLLAEVIRWILHANVCYIHPRWDANAGALIPEEMPPEFAGEPQRYRRAGKIAVDVLSPMQVYPQKEARNWAQCGDVIIEHLLTPSQVMDLWPDMVRTPEADTVGTDGTVLIAATEMEQGYGSGNLEYVRVLERFILPCRKYPAGRHVCATREYLLTDEPYGEPEFPIIQVTGEPYPMSMHGRSWMWDLLGPQRACNAAHTQIQAHVDLACNPPWLVPRGGVDTKDITKRPGAIIEYDHTKGTPQIASFATVEPWVRDIPNQMQKVMADLSVSEVLQGRVPYSGMSGRTIAFISDLDSTRLGTMAKSIATFLGVLGETCLDLVKQYGPDSIVFRALDESVAEMVAFQKTILRYGSVRVTESALLPQPASVRREVLLQQLQVGAITQEEYKEALRGAGGPDDTDLQREDRAWARDNIVTIQQGGQPFTGAYMDFPVHIHETRRFMKSARFRRQPPEIIQRFEEYEQKLVAMAAQLAARNAPPQPPTGGGAPAPGGEAEGADDQPASVPGQAANPGVNASEEQALGMGNLP